MIKDMKIFYFLKTKLIEDSSFEREKAKQLIRERVFSISPALPLFPSPFPPPPPSPSSSPPSPPTTTITTLKPLISTTTEIELNSSENIDEEEKEEGEEEELKEDELTTTTTIISRNPPGMMPPNDNIVDELNNANDFMEVANRLGIIEMFNTKTTTNIF
uniref:Candidate secreted effector n=1 Tax=Meloidogyne incognita TaxID=6306 RepID=A0A914N676_MELIC